MCVLAHNVKSFPTVGHGKQILLENEKSVWVAGVLRVGIMTPDDIAEVGSSHISCCAL